MVYQVYIIEDAFKDVMDESVLRRLLSFEKNAFQKRQLSYFFKKITPEMIDKQVKDRLKNREDIIEKDNQLTHIGIWSNDTSLFYIKEGNVYIESSNLENVFYYTIKSLFPTSIFLPF